MKVDLYAPVVLRPVEPEVWHIPAPAKRLLNRVTITLDEGLQRLTTSWPTLCDGVTGEVFVYGGFVRRRRLCRGCAFVNRQEPLRLASAEREAITDYEERRELEPGHAQWAA